MGNIGDPISTLVPGVGAPGTQYASDIDSLLSEFKTRLVAKVPLASVLVNADLPMSGNALLNAKYLTLQNEAASPVSSPVNRVTTFGGDLWYVSPSGAVQITLGATLNAASVGGIGGDYTAVGALASFDDLSDAYWFQQQVGASVRQYARIRSGDLELFEYKAAPAAGVPTNRVRLASPASLAASYQVTFPAAVPATTVALQMSNAGVLTASNTFASPTLTGTVDATGATIGGNPAFSSGLSVPAGQVLASNGNFTHTSVWPTPIHVSSFVPFNNPGSVGAYAGVVSNAGFNHNARSIANSASIHASLTGLRVGDRILTVNVLVFTGSGISTIPGMSININRERQGASVVTVYGATVGSPGTNEGTASLTGGSYTVGNGDILYLELLATATATNLFITGVTIQVDHP